MTNSSWITESPLWHVNIIPALTSVMFLVLFVFSFFSNFFSPCDGHRVISDTVVVRSVLLFHTAQVTLHTWTAEGKALVTHNTPQWAWGDRNSHKIRVQCSSDSLSEATRGALRALQPKTSTVACSATGPESSFYVCIFRQPCLFGLVTLRKSLRVVMLQDADRCWVNDAGQLSAAGRMRSWSLARLQQTKTSRCVQ